MEYDDIPKLQNMDISGKRVLTRVDFNVPLQDGKVADDTRIRASLPTINYIIEQGGRLVLMSHLGRPAGKPDPRYSLEPVAICLAKLLSGGEVTLTDSCVGDGARRVALDLRDGEVALLENLRFHAGEATDDEKFARDLVSMGEVYVNDAFGTVHRAHASVSQVARQMRFKASGLLLEAEMKALDKLLGKVDRPFVAVLGGAKVSDKIEIVTSMIEKVDTLIIGGAMANSFSAALGGKLGKSLVESDKLPLSSRRAIVEAARGEGPYG